MTVHDAFTEGLRRVRGDGFEIRGNDIAAIAAYRVFDSRASVKQGDPRFPIDGPKYAKIIILEAMIVGENTRKKS